MNDSTLLRRFIDTRDQSAFAELVARHGGMVHATARRIAGEDADDVSQAVFLLLAQRAESLAKRPDLGGWLYQTTCFCAANARRASGRRLAATHAAAENLMAQPHAPSQQGELLQRLDRALSRLPVRYRHVILLRYLESLRVDATADRLGISASAVMKRSSRGLARLRAALARRDSAVTAEMIVGCMATQAGGLSAGQRAGMVGVASGSASPTAAALASATARTIAIAPGKIIAVAAVCTIGGALILIPAAHLLQRRAAQPPASSITIAATPPPKESPVVSSGITPNTATAPQEALDQFLDALVARDPDHVARYLLPGQPAQVIKTAQRYIDQYPAGLYARFPRRLTDVVTSMTGLDRTGHPSLGVFGIATPIDAQTGHLSILIVSRNGHWYVGSINFIDNEAVFHGTVPKTDATNHPVAHPADPEPMRTLVSADGKTTMSIPGPVDVPQWMWQTPAYRQWLIRSGLRLLIARDDAGNIFTLVSSMPMRNADGSVPIFTGQIHEYRPDNTLAAAAEWENSNQPTTWRVMDATGKQMLWRADTTRVKHAQPQLSRVVHFDPDGSEHVYDITGGSQIARSQNENPISLSADQSPAPSPSPMSGGL